MFRRQLLPCACLTFVLGVAALTAAAPSWGQDLTTEERIDRLERDLNMLQRQVYQGAPPPPVGAPNSGAAVDIEVRMERLEQQMRDLTGRVEEIGNRVEQLRQRIEQVNSDVDMRLGEAPGAAAAAGPTGPPPPPPPSGQPDVAAAPPGAPPFPPTAPDTAPMPATLTPPGAGAPPGEPSSEPTPIFGTLTPPGAAPPTPPPPPRLATAAPPPNVAPPATLPGGSPAEQFDYAFKLVRKADYPAAEAALKTFVERHPKDRLAGSAQYWLGETYYARHRYLEAASAFAEGYKRYPKGLKAPDDLLKLGMALARANQKQNACLAFTQLDHDFPRAGAAVRERVIAERRRLGC
ncbi:MAG TPA: tol-pal system protein YbgF [Stellaceae bacterium]|nr:tol-pal system protein YbgF [Stellaceae bacterium]